MSSNRPHSPIGLPRQTPGVHHAARQHCRLAAVPMASALLVLLAACGGGSSTTTTSSSTSTSTSTTVVIGSGGGGGAVTPPVVVPVVLASCLDANVTGNTLGADDPFYVNAWHLENTGPTQAVSAAANNGLAGIDANVKAVHAGGRGCTGKGVTIAVLDSALELAHEDLASNVLTGRSFNFINNSSDPSPAPNRTDQDHGTGVAGVAAARGWNGKGSRGIAPFASLVGYNTLADELKPKSSGKSASDNMFYLATGSAALADATLPATRAFGTRADTVDIFNMSFGADYAAAPLIAQPAGLHAAIKKGTQTLRGGLGAVYLQSAGNGMLEVDDGLLPSGAEVSFNCATMLGADLQTGGALAGSVLSNIDGLTCGSSTHEPDNKPYAYQVASVHNTGRASSYSSSGSANWVSGFGGEYGTLEAAIISADDSGCSSGVNNTANRSVFSALFTSVADAARAIADLFGASSKDPGCNYSGQMNGTSAAAPSVAGVVALMLEVNPRLTWQDVGFILAKTARKVDAGIATGARAVRFSAAGASSSIELDLPWQTNSAGFNFQNRYGFGMVDAAAATNLARGFVKPAGRRLNDLTATGGLSRGSDSGGGKYTTHTAQVRFSDTVAVSGQMQLDLELTNATGAPVNPGRVQFELTNTATGQTSVLLPAFTAWYVGGKTNLLPNNGQQKFRFHTNAFYGDKLSDGFTVRVIYVKDPAATTGNLSFTPLLTSFSL